MLCVSVAALLLTAAVPAAAASHPVPAWRDRVRSWRQTHEREVVRELASLLALPNLAKDDAAIRANATRLREMLARRGVTSRLLEVEGSPPAVYGEKLRPGARRTIVFYAH